MEYRHLGKSGLKVPVLSFGTGTFGGKGEFFSAWGSTDVAEARTLIDICMDAGVNMFDSADIYSGGAAESVLGEALKGRPRDRLLISTKATFRSGDGPNDVGSSRQHLFYVDIASDSGMHLMRKDSHGDSVRYMRSDSLKAQIEEVQAGLRHGRLYAGYGAGAVFPVEQHVALLAIIEKLYRSIVAGSENRIEERTHFEDREVDVTVGVERVMAKVRAGPSLPAAAAAPMFTPSDTIEITPSGLSLLPSDPAAHAVAAAPAGDPEVERWRVHDLSSKGYGLLVSREAAETILLNGLLALQNHETGGWIVGSVVRKLANRVKGEMLIGVEVLAFRPIPVELAPAAQGHAIQALYLPGPDTNGKQDAIVVRAGEFTSSSPYLVRAGGSEYRIRLNRIIQKGADWIKARFEIEAKQA